MYNPKKVWLLYAQKIYNLLWQNRKQIPILVRNNLIEVINDLRLNLTDAQKTALFETALAFFETEYLAAYRRASRGEEPETKLSALQSCAIVEETMGYPVTDLFQAMKQEILNNQDKPEESVVDILIKKFGAYPARAILKIDLKSTPLIENHLPDFCLAKSIQTITERY